MTRKGYVKVYRKMLDHSIWLQLSPPTVKLWLYCLFRANYEPCPWYDGKAEVILPEGTFIFSQEQMALECRLSRKQIRVGLRHLQNLGCVSIQKAAQRANAPSVLSVSNYSFYQRQAPAQGQLEGQQRANGGADQRALCKEVEEEKEEKQQHVPLLTENEWPLTTQIVQGRFQSVDSFFVLRLVQDSVQAAISSGLDPVELTDRRLCQIVNDSINEDFARPGKTAGLLLKTVPQIIRNRAKRFQGSQP